jgi:hypothetical protein
LAPITYQLVRDGYALELSLDDETKSFTVVCNPPAVLEQPDVQKQTKKWCAHVGRGFAQRHGFGWSTKVKFIECRKAGTLRGQIITTHCRGFVRAQITKL